ncbi:MAG: tRNA (adenosine(37)-N6)-threonylcarbamoyltransferase complex transferase subunit TsaD [Patescibacteria group bacterium]|nr:tRNA (adenosine(37)-N6)-threonylcarbamoyltransferase complex transferase subunit TsaD [Patescibacteria group bacterium]
MIRILAIDTSCDETAVAITEGRRVLSNVIYSQALIHKKWGGVVPSLAKRAHEEKIDFVIEEAVRKLRLKDSGFSLAKIGFVAVTQGPGLAVALEVGIKKAKELSAKYEKKLIAINHLEGHLYSPFVQNRTGKPEREFRFPYLVLVASGGHTNLVVFNDHLSYQMLGETVDDAAGEALDKAAKLLGLGYPGGPVIERLAKQVNNQDFHRFPRPMLKTNQLDFSFSGLKTSFYYYLKQRYSFSTTFIIEKKTDLYQLTSSFQQAVFETLVKKTERAIRETGIKNLCLVGGVSANRYLRTLFRGLAKKYQGDVLFPSYPYLTGDNAAMIGVVGYYKALQGKFIADPQTLDRQPRLLL